MSATPENSPPPVDLAGLLDLLREQDYPVGPSEAIDAGRMLRHCQNIAEWRGLCLKLRPIFCKTPRQQQGFEAIFERWIAGDKQKTAAQVLPKRRIRLKPWLYLAVILAGSVPLSQDHGHSYKSYDPPVIRISPKRDAPPSAPDPNNAQANPILNLNPKPFHESDYTDSLIPFALLLALIVSWLIVYYRKKPRLRRVPSSGEAQHLYFSGWTQQSRDERLVLPLNRDTVDNLRLPSSTGDMAASRRHLHIRRTVEASVRRLGLPKLHYRPSRIKPSYLILIESDGSQDYYLSWVERWRRADLDVASTILVPPDVKPAALHLPDPPLGQRLIMLGTGASLADKDGKQSPWMRQGRFERWPLRVLFTPTEPRDWDKREKTIESPSLPNDIGFLILPLDDNAQASCATWLAKGEFPEFVLSEPQRFPSLLKQHGELLLQENPEDDQPDIFNVSGKPDKRRFGNILLSQLKLYLGENGFYWLCACAVPPIVNPQLTYLLGEWFYRNSGAKTEPRLRYHLARNYRLLIRLPWIRRCQMPIWLRLSLLSHLSEALKKEVREAVNDVFDKANPGPPALAAPGRFELVFDAKLQKSPGYALFVHFRNGDRLNQLELDLPASWKDWLPPPAPWYKKVLETIRKSRDQFASWLQALLARLREFLDICYFWIKKPRLPAFSLRGLFTASGQWLQTIYAEIIKKLNGVIVLGGGLITNDALRQAAAVADEQTQEQQPPGIICPACFEDKGQQSVCPFCGFDASKESVKTEVRPLPPGTQLQKGRYILGRVLGDGGQAITYLALDSESQAKRAIKEFLPKDFAHRDPESWTLVKPLPGRHYEFNVWLNKFRREATILSSFEHPNIIRMYDIFEGNNTAYLVMEYTPGQTLKEFFDKRSRRPMLPLEAFILMLPMLNGVDELHRRHFVHRDIKPGNIYLTGKSVILLDFGAARTISKTKMTYMIADGYSPIEQYEEHDHRQGVWTDVYACAATLYELVTGRRPVEANIRRTYNSAVDKLKPANEIVKTLSKEFSDALMRGLVFEPEKRTQSIHYFREELQKALGVPLTPAAWPYWTKQILAYASASLVGIAATAYLVMPTNDIEMVAIPGGNFMMASDDADADAEADETPRNMHRHIGGFKLGKYEVTQGQWSAVMGNNPSLFTACGENCPVDSVSWKDIEVFVQRLNAKTGRRYRLPTEAEWEYACRGGNQPQQLYCGGKGLDALAWYSQNAAGTTRPVGGKRANGFKLFDMSGNVWEWTCSAYAASYDGSDRDCAEAGPFVLRGGSWANDPRFLRSANRNQAAAEARSFTTGFRLAED